MQLAACENASFVHRLPHDALPMQEGARKHGFLRRQPASYASPNATKACFNLHPSTKDLLLVQYAAFRQFCGLLS